MVFGKAFLKPGPAIRRVEERAAECLELCRKKLRLSETPLPIPVDDWIEGPLAIRFGISDLSHLGAEIDGAAFVRDREILVSDRLLMYEPRYRFTCAHELGHVVLHGAIRRVFQDEAQVGFTSKSPYERQADRFAAAFLMPLPLVVRQLFQICEDRDLRQRECIVELMMDTPESEWLWKKHFLPVITRRFGVSLTAAINRFRDIQLHDGKPFLLPRHVGKLLRRAEVADAVAAFCLDDGFPRRIDRLSP